jgi:DMSO reductase anchor subunit
MTSDRKKPGVAFWATVVLSVVVLYCLSAGPVIWLYSHGTIPDWADAPTTWFYVPLDWLAHKYPVAFFWYADLWGWKL